MYDDVDTYKNNGDPDRQHTLSEINNHVNIYIPLPDTHRGKTNYGIYRHHDGMVQEIPRAPGKNSDGEYFRIENNTVIITVKKFSVYVIAYEESTGSTGSQSDSGSGGNTGGGGRRSSGASSERVIIKPADNSKVTDRLAVEKDSDVSGLLNTDDHFYYVVGRGDDKFWPDANLTRAETAQMFYNLLRDRSITAQSNFPDVAEDAWYAKAVGAMAALGIISGYPDGTFRPDAPITRAEFATVTVRFAKLSHLYGQLKGRQFHFAGLFLKLFNNYRKIPSRFIFLTASASFVTSNFL